MMLTQIILLTLTLIFTISVSFSIILFSLSNSKKIGTNNRVNKIKNSDSYISVLHVQMEKAYQMVYKNRILPYSMDAYGLDENNYNAALRDFNNLVLRLLGPNLQEDLIDFFGNYETLAMNMSDFFNNKYENDEVRKTSFGNLMNQENTE